MKILALNAGSSSQKSRLYEIKDALPADPPTPLWQTDADWTDHPGTVEISIKTGQGATQQESVSMDARESIIKHMLDTLWNGNTKILAQPSDIDIVGHRIVHGGQKFRESTFVTPEVKAAIERFAVFAPLQNPANLEGIKAIEQILPSVPQVAVFDTAFHSHMPLAATVYPGPYEWFEQDIRRYGFHGISHQYCSQRTAHILGCDLKSLNIITCHLGNGCSLAAVQNGHSIDTTMGFTPLEGLMMGTRSGSVDPGILIHLLQHQGYSADQLDQTLNKASGLQGVSGISSDMRQILKSMEEGNERAKLAYDVFVHRLRSCIGAMLATLGRLDALVFAAGIGENAAPVRAAACEAFGFLDLKLDAQKNAESPADQDIATADSSVRVLVVHTQEDWMIAQECWKLAQRGAESKPTHRYGRPIPVSAALC
jgi:acetate kinase